MLISALFSTLEKVKIGMNKSSRSNVSSPMQSLVGVQKEPKSSNNLIATGPFWKRPVTKWWI